MKVAYSGGEREVNIGDRATFYDGSTWEIVRLSGAGMYSPSGIGGTAVFNCKPIGEVASHYLQFQEPDGTVAMCGDSLAGALARGSQGKSE